MYCSNILWGKKVLTVWKQYLNGLWSVSECLQQPRMAETLRRRQRLEEEEQRAGSGTDRGGVSDIDSDRAVVNEEHMRRRIGQDKVHRGGTQDINCPSTVAIIRDNSCLSKLMMLSHIGHCSHPRLLMLLWQGCPASGGIMLSGCFEH